MKCKYHTIKYDRHRTNKPKLKLHWGKTRLAHKVTFTDSCIYKTKDKKNQKDINKLFGLSYGWHHKNSIRFGWRCNGDRISILAYMYRDDERVNEWDENIYIEDIDINKEYSFEISFGDGNFLLAIFDKDKLIGTTILKAGNLYPLGYYLNPYFGGDEKAPHDISIKICDTV